MTDVDFGTLVSRVLTRMDYAESELTGDERRDARKALAAYKASIAEEIRQVFDEEEVVVDTPAQVPPPCTRCGEPVEAEARFCGACGLPLTADAIPRWLNDAIAKDAGAAADDPRVMQAFIRLREEDPEGWSRLMQKIDSARPVGA